MTAYILFAFLSVSLLWFAASISKVHADLMQCESSRHHHAMRLSCSLADLLLQQIDFSRPHSAWLTIQTKPPSDYLQSKSTPLFSLPADTPLHIPFPPKHQMCCKSLKIAPPPFPSALHNPLPSTHSKISPRSSPPTPVIQPPPPTPHTHTPNHARGRHPSLPSGCVHAGQQCT